MKKPALLTLTYLLGHLLIAQYSHQHTLKVGLGKEWNAFLNPSFQLEEDELIGREDLWDNGTFQSASLSNSFKVEKDKHRFKFKADGSLGIYQTEQNTNRGTIRLSASYRTKYASKKYLEVAPEYFRKFREGINEANAILRTPFAYRQFRIPIHFDFYLGNKAWLKTHTGYLSKNFDQPGQEELFYNAPFFGTSLSKKWTSKGSTRKLTYSTSAQFRKYGELNVSFFDDEEEDEFELVEDSREWNYFFNDLLYDIKLADRDAVITVGIQSTIRTDLEQRNGYFEVGPSLSINKQWQKWKLSTATRYSIRNYSHLAPGADNDQLLIYNYLRMRLGMEYTLKKNQTIYWRGNLVNRESNNPNLDRLAFRDYTNGSFEMGLKFGWK